MNETLVCDGDACWSTCGAWCDREAPRLKRKRSGRTLR